jgi:hypothetical protein
MELMGFGRAMNISTQQGVSTMTSLKLLGVAAILSATIVVPAMAQEAVQEPGAQAFYQSLGVGSNNVGNANAFAAARGADLSVAAPTRHHVRAPKH